MGHISASQPVDAPSFFFLQHRTTLPCALSLASLGVLACDLPRVRMQQACLTSKPKRECQVYYIVWSHVRCVPTLPIYFDGRSQPPRTFACGTGGNVSPLPLFHFAFTPSFLTTLACKKNGCDFRKMSHHKYFSV